MILVSPTLLLDFSDPGNERSDFAEVVGVPERGSLARDLVEARASLVTDRLAPVAIRIRRAVASPPDLKLVKVAVPPPERRLDHLVALVERAGLIDSHAAPDRWLRVQKRDL